MHILVYGAGALGSYLAYELVGAGHEVSVLARGKRYTELAKGGLIIRHYLQRKTTKNIIRVVDSFSENDYYDAVFVVVQQTQVETVIPDIVHNTKCSVYILIGNNATAPETAQRITEESGKKPMVLFGFLGVAGRRENGKVISIHKRKSNLIIGDVTKRYHYKKFMDQIFQDTNLMVKFVKEMDSWLKYHLAFILPIAYACYSCMGDLRKLAWNKKAINQIIDAIEEGYKVLEDLGYPLEPKEDSELFTSKRKQLYRLFKIAALTPLGKLLAGDHCMNAPEEMYYLDELFSQLIKYADVRTPNWLRLQGYMREYRKKQEKASTVPQ